MSANANILYRAQLQHVGAWLWDRGHPQQSQEVGHVRVTQVQDGAHQEDAQEVLRTQKTWRTHTICAANP